MTQTIVPRRFDVDFSGVPRRWMAGSAAPTAVVNSLSLMFPAGEVFFARTLKHFNDRIDDPVLRAHIKGFCGQESRHAIAHEKFNAMMRAQGYEIDRFIETYKRFVGWLETQSPSLKLSITAALEQYTAIVAEASFTPESDAVGARTVLDAADLPVRRLLAWHAAEELEHKAVAFDVLQSVNPSYALRITGLACATAMLGAFWFVGASRLLRQDGMTVLDAWREFERLPECRHPVVRRTFVDGIRQYLRRGFHPNNQGTDGLAEAWFKAHGMTMPDPA